MKSICNFVFNFIETSVKRFNIVECLSIISTTFVQYLDKLKFYTSSTIGNIILYTFITYKRWDCTLMTQRRRLDCTFLAQDRSWYYTLLTQYRHEIVDTDNTNVRVWSLINVLNHKGIIYVIDLMFHEERKG